MIYELELQLKKHQYLYNSINTEPLVAGSADTEIFA